MRFQRVIPFLCLFACKGLSGTNTTPAPPATGPAQVTVPPGGSDTGTEPEVVTVPECAQAPAAAKEVMEDRCSACHGLGSPEYGGFNDATDAEGLIDDGWVIPNDPDNSPIFIRIYADEMPTAAGGGPLTAEEKGIIQQWISCGAEDWGVVGGAARGFIDPEVLFEAAKDDANDLDREDQPFARYISLVSLYNGGVPTDRIELYAAAVRKGVWALTSEANPPVIEPVDLEGVELDDGTVIRIADGLGESLLFRVDEEEFGWDNVDEDVDVWEEMVKLYPFAIQYDEEFDAAEDLVAITQTRIPIVEGDWIAANAHLPPIYNDVLNIPNNFAQFLDDFGGINDLAAQFDNADAQCAGMDGNQSLVSQNNRVMCRYDSVDGYCWNSFDYGSVANQKNIFAFPDQFLVEADGGEAFCSLDNGQQVYFVFDAAGNRLDEAPINVVSDYNPDSGGIVKPGLHCDRCHELGVIERLDQVREAVLSNEGNFEDDTITFVEDIYIENSEWTDVFASDIGRFQLSVDALDVPIGEEVGWALSEDYEAPLTAARVAAVLGIPEGELAGRLASNDNIQVNYQTLDIPGGVVTRDLFEEVARDTICDLQLGQECPDAQDFCGLSAVPCLQGSICDNLGQCTKLVQ